MANTVELNKTDGGEVQVVIRSEGERDLRANVEDPESFITTLAMLAGLNVNVTRNDETPPDAPVVGGGRPDTGGEPG